MIVNKLYTAATMSDSIKLGEICVQSASPMLDYQSTELEKIVDTLLGIMHYAHDRQYETKEIFRLLELHLESEMPQHTPRKAQ